MSGGSRALLLMLREVLIYSHLPDEGLNQNELKDASQPRPCRISPDASCCDKNNGTMSNEVGRHLRRFSPERLRSVVCAFGISVTKHIF